jgi:hypothetical protein
MLFGLSQAYDVEVILSLRVGHVHERSLEPPNGVQPKLTVPIPVIFQDRDRTIENRFASNEIDVVVSDVRPSLCLVPGRHPLIVATNSATRKIASDFELRTRSL